MDEREVKSIVRQVVDEYFSWRVCPNCKKDTTLLKFNVWEEEGEEGEEGGTVTKLRCLNCSTVFREELVKE